MLKLVRELKPSIGAFDTETTGLHIILSTPFLFQFGFLHPNEREGYTFAVDLEKQPNLATAVIKAWHKEASKLDKYFAHNAKYDLHMLCNAGLEYHTENVCDTQFYIRYSHDAVTTDNGGPPLALKEYAAKYIDRQAKSHDKLLQAERTQIAKDYNVKLKNALGLPMYAINDMFKDKIFDIEDMPENLKDKYMQWHSELPEYLQQIVSGRVESDMIRYDLLDRDNLIRYAHYDIIYTLEIYLLTKGEVSLRENESVIQIEKDLIFPFYEMERVGFKADVDYVTASRIKMKNYIQRRRADMNRLAGEEMTTGQHAKFKEILEKKYGVLLDSTGSEVVDLVVSNLKREGTNLEAVEFIEVVQELRTLEKWYSTYIMRFVNDLKNTDRLYTTIHQVGPVTGRVSSDFQQFPKDGIKTIEGDEIFKPRKLVTPTGGEYDALLYLDFSQIELRFQAFYTILVGNPDWNLCRAYMPMGCYNSDGVLFDYTNLSHIISWDSPWYNDKELTDKWIPTDVHGATTTAATGLTPADKEFKSLRSKIGKRTNFAKNYGAQYNKIKTMFPDYSEEQVKRIDNAYYSAFPGVKKYHDYCYQRAQAYSYTENMFGVRYYGVNGHKLINMLVQGSAAFYLKLKIRELYDYNKKNNLKTRMQMQIHDELSWELNRNDPLEVAFEFKRIMEDWDDTYVPIVAEMECSTTTWAAKEEIEDVAALRKYLGNRP